MLPVKLNIQLHSIEPHILPDQAKSAPWGTNDTAIHLSRSPTDCGEMQTDETWEQTPGADLCHTYIQSNSQLS